MSEITFSEERRTTIHADQEGWSISVGDDRDGLELCEITYSESGSNDRVIILPWKAAKLFAIAVDRHASARS